MLTKEEFTNTLKFIKKQSVKQEKFIKALENLSPGCYCDCFLYDEYSDKMIQLLENIFEDEYEDIYYFLYDSEWLYDSKEDKKYPTDKEGKTLYCSPETLYDYLVANMKK